MAHVVVDRLRCPAPEVRAKKAVSARSRAWARWLFGFCALALLVVVFRTVDLRAALGLFDQIGIHVVWALFPSAVALAFEVLAWQRVFGAMGFRPRFASLFRVRVSSESLGAVLPMGALCADAVKPYLLTIHCGFPTSAGLAGLVARKYLLVLSQGGYLILGFFCGGVFVDAAFERTAGLGSLGSVSLVAAVALVLAAEGTAMAFRGGSVFQKVLHGLSSVPSQSWRRCLGEWRREVLESDDRLVQFFRFPWRTRLAYAAPCLAAWLCEAVETWVILNLLGCGVPWGDALAVETLVILARHVLVVLPGGLGAQEVGYAFFFGGVPGGLEACVVLALVKRLREVLWMALGFGFLARQRRVVQSHPAPLPTKS